MAQRCNHDLYHVGTQRIALLVHIVDTWYILYTEQFRSGIVLDMTAVF